MARGLNHPQSRQVVFKLHPDLLAKVDQAALQAGLTRSEFVRDLVLKHLGQKAQDRRAEFEETCARG